MGSTSGISEIVEGDDLPNLDSYFGGSKTLRIKLKPNLQDGKYVDVEDNIEKLLRAIDRRTSSRILGPTSHPAVDLVRKNAMKKPVEIGVSRSSGIGISESVTLKQALRKLCITQASEMAAMKRMSKPISLSRTSEAGTIKRLYASVVVQSSDSALSLNGEKRNLVEISILPDKASRDFSRKTTVFGQGKNAELSTQSTVSSPLSAVPTPKLTKIRIQDVIKHTSEGSCDSQSTTAEMEKKGRSFSRATISSSRSVAASCKTVVNPHLNNPVHLNKNVRKKGKSESASVSNKSIKHCDVNRSCATSSAAKPSCSKEPATPSCTTPTTKSCRPKEHVTPPCSIPVTKSFPKELATPASSTMKLAAEPATPSCTTPTTKSCRPKEHVTPPCSIPVAKSFPKELATPASSTMKLAAAVSAESKTLSSLNIHGSSRAISAKSNEFSRPREKGECSHSSKSSIGDYSSNTSISEESHLSIASGKGCRPHMSKDARWIAIRHNLIQQGSLGLKNFKLLKRLGCGDIGTVYLAELVDSECLFALKVMDIDFLVSRKKMLRAQTEREILQMLDHPFLPTLFAHFTTDNLSCLVMEYCPGGDLHVLRQKQPGKSFCEPAARFYVAEILLALEYLHMQGVIYRDLKPENILVREDGHIMLSDFDLSLRCSVSPILLRSSSSGTEESSKKHSGPCAENNCIDPLCLQPSWVQVSCFTPRLVSSSEGKARKQKSEVSGQVRPLPQLVVEPTDARSNSFVGTHEYLAPEIIRGDGHGSAVDWWTYGILLYELLFGRTPFKGPGNDETLMNVISQSLKFPENPPVSSHSRDLIRELLVKEPENRLGSVKGAAEIKQHPFFEGLNWALIRCAVPPETPRSHDIGTPVVFRKKKEGKCLDFRTNGENVEFELF